jgi:hypothetical protein
MADMTHITGKKRSFYMVVRLMLYSSEVQTERIYIAPQSNVMTMFQWLHANF